MKLALCFTASKLNSQEQKQHSVTFSKHKSSSFALLSVWIKFRRWVFCFLRTATGWVLMRPQHAYRQFFISQETIFLSLPWVPFIFLYCISDERLPLIHAGFYWLPTADERLMVVSLQCPGLHYEQPVSGLLALLFSFILSFFLSLSFNIFSFFLLSFFWHLGLNLFCCV